MWIEPPPKPSVETEQALRQLANYYRQLIAYHQQSAAIASSKLLQTETLLSASSFGDNEPLSMSGSISGSMGNFSHQPQFNSGEIIAELEETKVLPEVQLPNTEQLSQTLQTIFQINKGKMLRLDYLSLDVGEKLGIFPLYQPQLKIKLNQILEQGTSFGLWAKVPDSPECWTANLADFPDFAKNNVVSPTKARRKTRVTKKKPYNLSRLPACARLDEYGTLTGTIRACLNQFAPQPLDAHQIMAWMFPDGLSEKDKAKAYQAVSDGLNKGCSRKHWQRVEVGVYTSN